VTYINSSLLYAQYTNSILAFHYITTGVYYTFILASCSVVPRPHPLIYSDNSTSARAHKNGRLE